MLIRLERVVLTLGLLLCSNGVGAVECSLWDELNTHQQNRVRFAFNYGVEYDLAWTLAAITIVESSAGKYRLNLDSKDVGLFQINIKTATKILGVTKYLKKVELAQQLIYDDGLNAYLAVDVLEHFKKSHTYREMLMGYNTGYGWKKDKKIYKKGVDYANRVIYTMNQLKGCINFK
jgi:hypothetical protein